MTRWPTPNTRWPADAPRDENERYRLVYGVAYRAALKLLGDHATAEDLAQETWIAIERFLVRYAEATDGDELRNFSRWVARVSTNKAIKVYRSKWHRVLRDRPQSDSQTMLAIERAAATAPARRPDELAVLREYGEQVRAALEALSPAQAEAFRMYSQGYTHREIAEKLGAPVGTIKVRVHRARRHLAGLLRPVTDTCDGAPAATTPGRAS